MAGLGLPHRDWSWSCCLLPLPLLSTLAPALGLAPWILTLRLGAASSLLCPPALLPPPYATSSFSVAVATWICCFSNLTGSSPFCVLHCRGAALGAHGPCMCRPSLRSPLALCSWMASSCISASSRSAYASSRASLGGRALLCQRAMADVIFLLGPNNL
jgi:hypothetical protein